MENFNKIKKSLQSKTAAFIIAVLLVLIALVVRLEVIEPLIILFVIYCSINFAKKGAVYSTIFAISVLAVQDLYNLKIDFLEYSIEVLVVVITATYIYRATSRVENLNRELRERVKELSGLYKISEAAEEFKTNLEQLLNQVVQEISLSYQFPEDCEARITYQGNKYQTADFEETKWMQQKELLIDNKKVGKIEVVYLNKHPKQYQGTVFLKEESELLNSITTKITSILKNLEQKKEIEEQRRFLSITLNSIGDGVIVTDKEGRVKRLNSIAENLTGWSIEQAKNKDIGEIFKIVNPKTGIEVKNPVDKVLKNGHIVGLANHTKLISRDGEEYNIADSAAPIETDEGNIQGTVMVFRDVSQNYEMQEKIKQREKMFSAAISESPFPIMVHAEDGEVITLNSVWESITGYKKEEIPNIKNWLEKAYDSKIDEIEENIKESFTRQKGKEGEFEIETKNGEKRIWEFSTAPLGTDEDGRKLVISTAVDITRRKKAENELKKLNKIYRTLSMVNQMIVRENSLSNLFQEAAQITSEYGKYQNIWIGKIDFTNEKLKVLATGEDNYSYVKNGKKNTLNLENQFLNFKEKLINQEDDKLIINNCQNINESEAIPENDCGSRAFFLLKAFGEPWGVFSFCTAEEDHFDEMEINLLEELTGDISLGIEKIINKKRRQDSERRLKRSEKKYRQIFENSPVGIFKTTSAGKVEMINPYMAKILGFDSIEETINHYNDLEKDLYVNNERRDQFISQIKEKLMVNNFVYQAYDKHKNILWLEMNARICQENEDGSFVIDGFCWDITERHQREEKIKYMGFHDKLTGLYNRAFLEEEIKRVDTSRQLPISIIMGDLNNLKLINDTYGHQTGDQLIEKAAEMIEKSCRDEDIIARWGGDEFVILLPQTTVKESEEVIKRINQQMEREKGELAVSISLGTAVKTDSEQTLMAVLTKSEDRMYKNKIANRKSARSSVLSAFLASLKEKSSETEEHVQRMSKLAKRFSEKVGLSNSEQDRLYLLTQMHDIGKIAVSEEILNKPDKLNEEEWEVIKKHTETGFRITSNFEDFAHISHEILHHHERWDGSGYPEGLVGKDIPLLSRMLTIIDSYDVMISGRPYKEAMTETEAASELKSCAGSQFDPELVDKFIESL